MSKNNKIFSSFLTKLNPSNSLFGKIFVWFWLSVSVLLVAAFLLARLTRMDVEVSQLTAEQLMQAEIVMERVQRNLARGLPPERALNRASMRDRLQLILVKPEQKELILGFPRPMLAAKEPILELSIANQPVLLRTSSLEFIGPLDVLANNNEYKLFVGRLLRRDERAPASWGINLFALLCIGSLLCVFLAWRLSKPLGILGEASRAFANGDLTVRVPENHKRKDEIGHLATDFNHMADSLNASIQQQQLLMANVSHELRTPLTRLQLSVAMLQEKYGEDDYFARIEREIVTMDRLIGQILRLTRMQNVTYGKDDQGQNGFKMHDLANLIPSIIENLEFEASASGKQLKSDEVPDIRMSLNADALISAIENITRNAIKFSKHNIFLRFEVTRKTLSVHIDDDGDGLSPEQLSKLFDAFYQAPNTPNDHSKGVGLGLAIAKAAVNMHDGTLSVAPSQYSGLCFSINLPRIDKETGRAHQGD